VEELGSCNPIIKIKDLWEHQQVMLNENKIIGEENLELPAIPCGLIAKSFFNDTFELYKCDDDNCFTNIEKR
jgi:hypothetical protein